MPDVYVLRLEASGEVTRAKPDDTPEAESETETDTEAATEEVEQ